MSTEIPECDQYEAGHEWWILTTYVKHGYIVRVDECECGTKRVIDENGTHYEGFYSTR